MNIVTLVLNLSLHKLATGPEIKKKEISFPI